MNTDVIMPDVQGLADASLVGFCLTIQMEKRMGHRISSLQSKIGGVSIAYSSLQTEFCHHQCLVLRQNIFLQASLCLQRRTIQPSYYKLATTTKTQSPAIVGQERTNHGTFPYMHRRILNECETETSTFANSIGQTYFTNSLLRIGEASSAHKKQLTDHIAATIPKKVSSGQASIQWFVT